jgi:hypothetical protein
LAFVWNKDCNNVISKLREGLIISQHDPKNAYKNIGLLGLGLPKES